MVAVALAVVMWKHASEKTKVDGDDYCEDDEGSNPTSHHNAKSKYFQEITLVPSTYLLLLTKWFMVAC